MQAGVDPLKSGEKLRLGLEVDKDEEGEDVDETDILDLTQGRGLENVEDDHVPDRTNVEEKQESTICQVMRKKRN